LFSIYSIARSDPPTIELYNLLISSVGSHGRAKPIKKLTLSQVSSLIFGKTQKDAHISQ